MLCTYSLLFSFYLTTFVAFSDRIGGLDSLIRLLLGVEPIQPKVAVTLLEKLPEYIDDDGME